METLTWCRKSEAVLLVLRGATVKATWKIALVVGTILSVVNQLDSLIDDPGSVSTWFRVGFNYLVPFLVASSGLLVACRVPEDSDGE